MSNPLRFQGQYHDLETALHYNRYRYYEPKMARYISRDPIGLLGGLNVYSYVSNTPVMRVDPLGLWDAPFSDIPSLQARQSLASYMVQNGEEPGDILKALAPPKPNPVITLECRAQLTGAVGVGMSGNISVNSRSGFGATGSYQMSTIAARGSLSCGLKISDPNAKPLPVGLGGALGLGFLILRQPKHQHILTYT